MANFCTTQYIIIGNEPDIKRLEGIFKQSSDIEYVLASFDKRYEQEGRYGNIDCFEVIDGTEMSFTITSKWCRIEQVEMVLKKAFSVYFQEEEMGCGIFRTNDDTGDFFPLRFFLSCDGESEYYEKEEDAVNAFNDIFDDDLPWKAETAKDIDIMARELDDDIMFKQCITI